MKASAGVFYLPFFIIIIVLAIIFGLGDHIPDYLMAKTIAKYPAAMDYRVYTSSGFWGASPTGYIKFQTTDAPEQVLTFYKNEFTNDGWTLAGQHRRGIGQEYEKDQGIFQWEADVYVDDEVTIKFEHISWMWLK